MQTCDCKESLPCKKFGECVNKNPTTDFTSFGETKIDEVIHTTTTIAQNETETAVQAVYEKRKNQLGPEWEQKMKIGRARHARYLFSGLEKLGSGYQSLDASRPWLCFWILHALELLNTNVPAETISRVVSFLGRCQDKDGGFCGGPGQLAHCAPTYAAISALVICGTEEAYKIIDREKLYQFLLRMKQEDGSFRMHENGEIDVRSAYCALAVASMCNIMTPELIKNTATWLGSCQTWEGGIGAEPFNEAHGGYTFCGYAALVILNQTSAVDKKSLLKWLVKRQMDKEGGFQGRTHKLVDACYSYWQGGVFPLMDSSLLNSLKYIQTEEELNQDAESNKGASWCFDQMALQKYLIGACQDDYGGLIDKPGKRSDYYHTCYALSGLSVAQHNPFYSDVPSVVFGDPENKIEVTHPVYNITPVKVQSAMEYFFGATDKSASSEVIIETID